ncbi:MAG TPA: capsule biosynthesis protein [Petrimonas sp.]|uniref:SLBB domain-containing protein n=1 Tax=Petrimonas sp. TaxID=2023866 RepID=UPI001752A003|nr:capsule biosynthesis protein [Petrimonas sp.]
MHKEYKFIGLLTLLFFLSTALFAQMSDQQVIQEVMKYNSQGMSQQQILLELNKKGVTASQLQRIQERYNQQNNQTGPATSNQDTQQGVSRVLPDIQPIERINPNDTIPPGERIFGQDFFSKENLTFAPNVNMPTPANYILGPGDEVIIDVWGDSELNVRYTITPDGYITVPGLGRIQLSGMRVDQATGRIRNEFSGIYSDLNSSQPHTFLALSVGNTRTIKVNVMGEVTTPGTYTLTSFSSAFHALYAAGGITHIGSLRNIRVFRGGRAAATVDLYEYLLKGNNMNDITLQDGDIVMIDPYLGLAQITGEIKRPMKYEMRPDETLKDLLGFAGGFTGEAYKNNVQIDRKGEYEKETFTVNQSDYSSFQLHDGDSVTISSILKRFSNMVEIDGAVNRPGQYAIGDQIRTVKDLVAIAQGITGDAYVYRALLYREQEDLRQTMESFDLDALLNNRIADIPLRKNDRLHIPSIFSLEDSVTVSVGGSVRAPGNYPFALNMRIEDAILRAGGLREEASTQRIDVYRRIKNPSSTTVPSTMSEVYTFTLQEGKVISNDPSFILHPYDEIVVRHSPGYEPQSMVTIKGEVLFGGRYAKKTRNERLSSLVERAGGLTGYAYPKGAKLTRQLNDEEFERLKHVFETKAKMDKLNMDSLNFDSSGLRHQYVGIDLEEALKRPGGDDDIVLREGDVISIPQYEGTVKISGGVLYPNIVTYDKRMSLDGYIRQAGGYSRLAIKSKPFIVYMNGKVATGRWAKIEPGCEIVVPEKPEREPMSLQGILGISTSIASIALLISNLVK